MVQVLGLLAALTLRNPSGGEAAMEAGCIDAALEVSACSMMIVHYTLVRQPPPHW